MNSPKVLIVGQGGESDVGRHLCEAATDLGLDHVFVDSRDAHRAPPPVARFNWRVRGRRPTRLTRTSRWIHDLCLKEQPGVLITTGFAPIDCKTLGTIGEIGIRRVNFSTDDPWNPIHRAPWFLRSLSNYDLVFTAREANIGDFLAAGTKRVRHLPFAYCQHHHFIETPTTPVEIRELACDLLFIGASDKDRLPYVRAAIDAGLDVALYGLYWDRYPETRERSRGLADVPTMRKATQAASTCLCLVRRANRDDNAMRTFEIPAMGGCGLMEDTTVHRSLFGPPGDCVLYFRTPQEAITHAIRLRDDAEGRAGLRQAAHARIQDQRNTYRDRLVSMLSELDGPA